MGNSRVVVVGSINMDLVVRCAKLPLPGQTVIGHDSQELPGGKGANQAVAAARLGAATSMVGKVGNDGFAARLRQGLDAAGIDLAHVSSTDSASGLAIVEVEDSGENAITVLPNANGKVTASDVELAAETIRSADALLVQLEIPLEAVAKAVQIAREAGVRTILDPAPAPVSLPAELLQVDVCCPNETEAKAILGTEVESLDDAAHGAMLLRQRGVTLAIITRGNAGAVLAVEGDYYSIDSPVIDAVDTTAAGDAFAGALATYLTQYSDPVEAVRIACVAGAIAASRPGAQVAMPSRDELHKVPLPEARRL